MQPYSESLFKTLKYSKYYKDSDFRGIDKARQWVGGLVQWYNTEHIHRAKRFVKTSSRHQGKDKEIIDKRVKVYEKAKKLKQLRGKGQTRNWATITEVCLNRKKHNRETDEELYLDPPSKTI